MLQLQTIDDVLLVTLARPEARNALNRDMLRRLTDLLQGFQTQPPRACVFTGSGSAFCAGGDLIERTRLSELEAVEVRSQVVRLFELLLSCPCPSIASVNGPARGGGFELALACDFIVCSERASFGLPEVGLGLMPGGGGTQTLARAVGVPLARQVILLGRILSSGEAVSADLAIESVVHEEVVDRSVALARHIASLPPDAVRSARAALAFAGGSRVEDGLRIESKIFETLRQSRSSPERP